jgi:hypothetical protein
MSEWPSFPQIAQAEVTWLTGTKAWLFLSVMSWAS